MSDGERSALAENARALDNRRGFRASFATVVYAASVSTLLALLAGSARREAVVALRQLARGVWCDEYEIGRTPSGRLVLVTVGAFLARCEIEERVLHILDLVRQEDIDPDTDPTSPLPNACADESASLESSEYVGIGQRERYAMCSSMLHTGNARRAYAGPSRLARRSCGAPIRKRKPSTPRPAGLVILGVELKDVRHILCECCRFFRLGSRRAVDEASRSASQR